VTEARSDSLQQAAARVIDLNLRYYRALGGATVDYVRSVASFIGDQTPLRSIFSRLCRPAPVAPPAAATDPALASIVLEAAAGEDVEAGFVVVNHLTRRISASFHISPFTDLAGRSANVNLRIDPPLVTLDPGMELAVRLGVRITDQLESGHDYRGTISVPGLADTPVAVILRRSSTVAVSPVSAAKPRKAPAGTRPRGSRKPRERK
jgi:hypothetical protein